MDQKRKLEILAAADFSDWRKRERARRLGQPEDNIYGFGNALFGIGGAASYLAMGRISEEYLQKLLDNYDGLVADYATIPFDEMDPQDPDFRFLFAYKKRLDDFGIKVRAFADKTRKNGCVASKNWPEYRELQDMLGELMSTDYREQVLKHHGTAFSEPSQ